MNVVRQLTADEMTRLTAVYGKWQEASKNAYVTFFAKLPGCTISAYTSGKVVFQGPRADELAGKLDGAMAVEGATDGATRDVAAVEVATDRLSRSSSSVEPATEDSSRDKIPVEAATASLSRDSNSVEPMTGHSSCDKISVEAATEQSSRSSSSVEPATEHSSQGSSSVEPGRTQFPLMGSDEVGNGSYFGGLIVVATFVADAEEASWLTGLGVDDSKKLTDARILQMAPALAARLSHRRLIVSPDKYNAAISQGYNAVSIKVALHNQVLWLLSRDLGSVEAATDATPIVDAFTTPVSWQKYVRHERHQLPAAPRLIPKAESQYLAVAAASILARASFLAQLQQLSTEAGVRLPSGAGTASDKVAAQLLAAGKALGPYAKLHFANTKKAQKRLKQ